MGSGRPVTPQVIGSRSQAPALLLVSAGKRGYLGLHCPPGNWCLAITGHQTSEQLAQQLPAHTLAQSRDLHPIRHGSSPRTWRRRPETEQGQTSPMG